MKKVLYCIGGAALLAFSACQSDEIAPVTGSGEASVSFRTELPAYMGSRSVSDGTTCEHLNVTVYDENGNYVFDCGNQYENAFAGSNLTKDVELKLVVGKTYKIVFWAFSPSSPYEFDATNATLDMNYDQTNVAQNEDRDMFFHMEEIEVKGDVQKSIPLVRPFAQVNIGTTLADYQAAVRAGATVTSTGTTFTADVYNTLNLLTGEASNPVSVEMGIAPILTTTLAATEDDMEEPLQLKTGEKYVHLSMNYLLMNNKGREALTSVTMHTDGTEDKIFANVPVERNYRTNIVGELFAANMTYNVYISPEYTDDITYIPVTTPNELISVIGNGQNALIPADANIDIKDKDEVELANGQTLKVEGTLNTARAQIGVSGEGNVAYVIGGGKITSEGIDGARGNRPLNVYDGATLVVKDVSIYTEQNDGGSSIYSLNGNIDIENVTIDCHHFAIGANGGSFKAKDCTITSDSNNQEGVWSYTVDIALGCTATMENCTVTGIQGGISIGGEGSVLTINGGTYQTVNVAGKGTAHYPVYLFDKGMVIVNDGDFISGYSQKYTIYNGNNDVPELYTWGNGCALKGGRYNGPTIDQQSKTQYPAAEGYEWVAIENDPVFAWQVVPKATEQE